MQCNTMVGIEPNMAMQDLSPFFLVLSSYVTYYHGARTHLSLAKDAPDGREVQAIENGSVVELKRVGGLHHLYTRVAA